MQDRRWGRFIAISSIAVLQPVDGLILSNAARSAVRGLVKSLSNEYAPYNVLVNNVCPGYTATERLKKLDVHPEMQIPHGTRRHAGGVREPGGVFGVGAIELHHRSFYSGGRGLDEGPLSEDEGALGRSGAG